MLNEGDLVKVEALKGETHYGAVVFTGEEGKHISICLHEEGDIGAQFGEHRVVEQPNDPTKRTYVDTVATIRGGDTIDT